MKYIKLAIFGLLVFYFYLLIGLFVSSNGYRHPEGIFLIEKGLLALKGNPPRLENTGLIYPPLPFYVLFPFIPFAPLASPFLASALGMSVLTVFVIYRLLKKQLKPIFFVLFFISITLNPILLYAGSSGSSIHLYLTSIVAFYILIFEHYSKPISFYLALSGVLLGLTVLIRYEIIFTLPALLFTTMVLSIETTIGRETKLSEFFKLLKELPTYRKTFLRKTLALYLMLFVPPTLSFLSWVYLNWIFTSNPFNFLESPYAYFRTLKTYALLNPYLLELKADLLKGIIEVSKNILILSPMFFYVLFVLRKKPFYFFTLLAPVTGLIISSYFGLSLMTVDFFAPFILLSFVGLMYAVSDDVLKNHNLAIAVYIILFLFSIYGGFKKLYTSTYPEEKLFVRALIDGETDATFKEDIECAQFLRQVTKPDETIIIDDSNGYPVVVFHGNPKNFILPYQYEFYSVVQTPEVYADYIVVYNPDKFEGSRDIINVKNENIFHKGKEGLELVFNSEKWRVYRTKGKLKTLIRR